MKNIIIQGQGVVGQSTELFLKNYNPNLNIAFNDPFKGITAPADAWQKADYVIICVNTDLDETLPLAENSSVNIDEAINEALEHGFKGKFILRSTIGVECVQKLLVQLGQHLIVWPEYIRESTWREDAINPKFIVIGSTDVKVAEDFVHLINAGYKGAAFITDALEAMIAKLSTNTFLAMKVIFANQVERLCAASAADYNVVKALLAHEGRLGTSHWDAPGPDGKAGFGGKCFPKDVKTFETALIKAGQHIDMIRAILDLNGTMRTKDE